jgi:choline dehydrogenase-like flavoprotein
VDASFFPSSAALNPALTVAAQALRVADHIVGLKLNEQVHRISTPESATTATPGG